MVPRPREVQAASLLLNQWPLQQQPPYYAWPLCIDDPLTNYLCVFQSTAYTNLNVLGDPAAATEVVVVYDKTHIETPKTLPKDGEVNYIFSVKLSFSRRG